MAELILDAVKDSLTLLPFLFLTYLLMEYIESHAMSRVTKAVSGVDALGPLFGGITGIVPQCGFSAAAASLFSGGVISLGTLLAVFLATSGIMYVIGVFWGFLIEIMGIL